MELNRLKLTIILLLCIYFGKSQLNQWTWMKGANTTNQANSYGTVGISAATNVPGARFGSNTWADNTGSLWLFGGNVFPFTLYSDLWRYDIPTNNWTWVKGPNTFNQGGTYGTQGVSSSANVPGGRYYSSSWIDNSGNFWLFGGMGYSGSSILDDLNDLWKYNPLTNEWTWMKGSTSVNQQGNYGTQGVPAAANVPGARHHGVTWTDNSGNLWLFGGYGYSTSATIGNLNDLWKYDIVSNQWTWVSGSNALNQNGTYGAQGVGGGGNVPGGRYGTKGITDNFGNLWLFGGRGFPATGGTMGPLNDLWRYNIASNQWTWMKGGNAINQNGTFGGLGTFAPTNTPGSKEGHVMWKDITGNIMLFGGFGNSATGTAQYYINDVWVYDISTNQWMWAKGSNTLNQVSSYGTILVASGTNRPGARWLSSNWTDPVGNIWLFGGYGYASATSDSWLNDLWKLTLTNLVLPIEIKNFGYDKKKNSEVNLLWETAVGTNIKNFQVERSEDAVHFLSIGIVEAKENAGDKKYTFNDLQSPSCETYYRLKINEAEDKCIYSKVLAVKADNSNYAANIFMDENQSISIRESQTDLVEQVLVLTCDGKQLMRYSKNDVVLKPGKIILPSTDLIKGIYFVKIETPTSSKTFKLLVNK
ncbi:MAG: Kelch repeat type 2-containing protein [Bacteroidetes bacterium]|jgi:N-acetylneuraminic acid mutarotase|nr:Kelch repeat type 2-containing protein [Bacteroidota bacterium]